MQLDALGLKVGPQIVGFRPRHDRVGVGPVGGDRDHRQADREHGGQQADLLGGLVLGMLGFVRNPVAHGGTS
jgi:hypothetical protein